MKQRSNASKTLSRYDNGASVVLIRTLSFEELGGYLQRLGYEPSNPHPHEIRDKEPEAA